MSYDFSRGWFLGEIHDYFYLLIPKQLVDIHYLEFHICIILPESWTGG
jgi:hypothetical protein